MNPMNIGQAAAAAGVTPKMVRHYESLGLIPAADRTDAGYRVYTPREVEMLRFIRQARAVGFAIPQIEALLKLWRDERRESKAVKELARQQLAELEERQRELDAMRATLSKWVEDCAGDERSCCAILEHLTHAPAAAQPIEVRRGATLKEVKAGSTVQRKRAPVAAPVRRESPHSGLMAWSRSFAAAA
ncbi:Cu(I)-responsive transcriptional regulator [Ramlibacter albus]|uniref:Cu(I)-responsive transcriptional regulator n=1 Tax=Ramlibacter albus TaxID=2079448 RepID=UPI00338D9889